MPGLFEANPVRGIVNGSLWTLRIEAVCYLGLLAMAGIGMLRRGAILFPLGLAWAAQGAIVAARAGVAPPVFASLQFVSLADCVLHFLMGATFWLYAFRIPKRALLAMAATLLVALAASTPAGPAALHLALPYVTLSIGLTRPITPRISDVSYGVYLYAFPVEQALVAIYAPLSPVALMAAAVPLTLVCAVLSRRLVETTGTPVQAGHLIDARVRGGGVRYASSVNQLALPGYPHPAMSSAHVLDRLQHPTLDECPNHRRSAAPSSSRPSWPPLS